MGFHYHYYERTFQYNVTSFWENAPKRRGWLIKYTDHHNIRWGEISPLYPFDNEQNRHNIEIALSFIKSQSKNISFAECLRLGLSNPLLKSGFELLARDTPDFWDYPCTQTIPITAFLNPLDPLNSLKQALQKGYVSFKLKISHIDYRKIPYILDPLWPELKANKRIRLDANQAFKLEDWKTLKGYWTDKPIEFIEEPLNNPTIDELFHCVDITDKPIALDEHIRNVQDITPWMHRQWPGYYVVKPILIDDFLAFQKIKTNIASQIIYSTAFETSIGLRYLIRLAIENIQTHALGIGALNWIKPDLYSFTFGHLTHFGPNEWHLLKQLSLPNISF